MRSSNPAVPLGILVKLLAPTRFCLIEGAMVGGDHLQLVCLKAGPQPIRMPLVAEGRRHHAAGGMVPVRVLVFDIVQRETPGQRLAGHPLALLPCPPDRLMGLLSQDVCTT